MKVHEILFVAWVIVFAFWAARQVAAANRRREKQQQD